MTSYDPTCTEPGRWDQAPDAEAPTPEILAYLQHCDLCEYHAMLNLEADLSLDVLLRDACRDLDADDVLRPAGGPARARAALTPWLRRTDRAPRARTLHERFHFEQRLTLASIAAFGIVVLWISFTAYPFGQADTVEGPVVAVEETAPDVVTPSFRHVIEGTTAGHLYVSQVLPDGDSGQPLQGGMLYDDLLPVAAPRQVGSVLRVTNPGNGVSVEVKVVERRYEEREIFLSSFAADSLGLDGGAIVFVEVLHTPPPVGLAP